MHLTRSRTINGVYLSFNPSNNYWTAYLSGTKFVFTHHKGKWTLWENEAWGPTLPISHRKTLKACANDAVFFVINTAQQKKES